ASYRSGSSEASSSSLGCSDKSAYGQNRSSGLYLGGSGTIRLIAEERIAYHFTLVADFTVIPSIEQLRQRPAIRVLEAQFGADATADALRATAPRASRAIPAAQRLAAAAVVTRVESDAAARLGETFRPSLAPVVNAPGV